jgi:hypothetical protein
VFAPPRRLLSTRGLQASGECFDIDDGAISEIDQRLSQMNIDEQSMFPDMDDLAGLIRQEIRLHWK